MTYPPVNKETHIGGTVTFDCVTENGRGTHTTWLHNAKQVFSDTFMTVTGELSSANILKTVE